MKAETKIVVVNLFIAHTRFQSYVATLMIERHPDFRGARNVLVCPPDRCHAALDSWSRVETPALDLFRTPNYIGSGEHVRLVRSYIEELSDSGCSRLMISNLWSPFNRLAYALASKCSNVRVAIYPEGLANLLVPEVHGVAKLREWLKAMALKAQGIPYRYTSKISGELSADIVYSFSPELMQDVGIDPHRLRRAHLEDWSEGEPLSLDKCLLIGQGCDSMFAPDEIRRSSGLVGALLADLRCKEVYCKAHPISRAVDEAIKPSVDMKLIDDDRLVEEIVPEMQCGLVISTYSSALFNLKLMFGKRIRCVSVMGDIPLSRHYMYGEAKAERYRVICRKLGVDLLE